MIPNFSRCLKEESIPSAFICSSHVSPLAGLLRASVYKQCRTPMTSFSIANMTKPFRLLTSHHIPSVSLLKHHWNFQSGCNVIIILIFHLGKLRSRDGNFYKVTARDRGEPHSPSMASKHLFPIPCRSVHRPIVPLPQQWPADASPADLSIPIFQNLQNIVPGVDAQIFISLKMTLCWFKLFKCC